MHKNFYEHKIDYIFLLNNQSYLSFFQNNIDQIHQKLTSLNYNLATLHPSYKFSKYSSINKELINDHYDYPKIKSKIVQLDSIYILNKKNTLREVIMLIGYGFLVEAFEIFKRIEKRIKIKDRNKLKIFFKKQIPKSIFKTL